MRVEVGERQIGPGAATFIVAELSANHGHDFDKAAELVRLAHGCGADAVKVQTYTADTLTIDCDREWFRIGKGTVWEGRTLHELYAEAYTPWEWQPELKRLADELGILFFSTPFDDTAVDFLETLDVPLYKIASFEIVDTGLLRKVASTGKPVILSTGMATLSEIDEAVTTLREGGAAGVALLKCTSAYPAPVSEMNLRAIPHLAAAFNVPAGVSDHTQGTAVPVAAVALGASIVEKHFTLSRAAGGPDAGFSLEPDEFRDMVASVRCTEAALGGVHYGISKSQRASRVFRRSLFVVEDVKKGDPFTAANVRSIRPGHGLPPRELPRVLGRRASRDIDRGTPLSWDLIA